MNHHRVLMAKCLRVTLMLVALVPVACDAQERPTTLPSDQEAIAAQGFVSSKAGFRIGVNPWGYGLSYAVGGENLLVEDPSVTGREQWSYFHQSLPPETAPITLTIAWNTDTTSALAYLERIRAEHPQADSILRSRGVDVISQSEEIVPIGIGGSSGFRITTRTTVSAEAYSLTQVSKVAAFRQREKLFWMQLVYPEEFENKTGERNAVLSQMQSAVFSSLVTSALFERILATFEITE